MTHHLTWMFLLLLFTLSISCLDHAPTGKESKPTRSNTSTSDTLNFHSGIHAIFHDSKGNYWFGSLQEGVALYDGSSFTYFTSKDGLADNQIHTIQEDKQGHIWFNTQSGLSSYDGTKITLRATFNQGKPIAVYPNEIKQTQTHTWKKTDSDLWFETGNQSGVYRYDGQQLYYLDLPPQQVLDPHDNLFAVTAISSGKQNKIWFATYAGVFGYNGKDFTTITDETLGYNRKVQALHIRSILEDSKGRLWIGNNGIGVLLKQGDSITHFSDKLHLIHANSHRNGNKSPKGTLEHVFVITEDQEGNIWFGDRDAGIWKYNGQVLENYTTKDGLTNDFALSIYQDKNGTLWFGMSNGHIYQFKGKTFEKQF